VNTDRGAVEATHFSSCDFATPGSPMNKMLMSLRILMPPCVTVLPPARRQRIAFLTASGAKYQRRSVLPPCSSVTDGAGSTNKNSFWTTIAGASSSLAFVYGFGCSEQCHTTDSMDNQWKESEHSLTKACLIKKRRFHCSIAEFQHNGSRWWHKCQEVEN
jgi:hypothetical protein